ncbi:MAG: hypothetical protein BWY93_00728 [Euryarchaeota archaeon ADurb.BinA087]|nr:MAG: hypothetical protein BWY93_00728 [Euryarchaeota archaeon ADurb.BinA087]
MVMKRILIGLMVLAMIAVVALPAGAEPVPVDPISVSVDLLPGDSSSVEKMVTPPDYPPVLDLLLLEDETGSFYDDIAAMQGGLASDIWEGIVAEVTDFQGGVAGFRDFAQDGWGGSGDWVYNLYADLTGDKTTWLTGVGVLSALGGADTPEAQLAALKAAVGHGWDSDGVGGNDTGPMPTWRTGATHVIMLVTDAPYHVHGDAGGWPGPTYDETITELNAAGVHVIILTAPGAGDYSGLAADTGGSVKSISDGSADIVDATLAALEEVKTDVWWEIVSIDPEISVTFDKEVEYDVSGGTIVYFTETITADSCAPAGEYHASVNFSANTYPEEGTVLGTQEITVTVLPIPVYVDVKPGSCPNAFNTKQKGVTPVAILGTDEFDVTTIDPKSVMLNGIEPLRWSYQDVATPYMGTDNCCWEMGGDGYRDLVLHFDSQALAGTLSGYTVKGDPIDVTITGSTWCGASIEGSDCIWVVH